MNILARIRAAWKRLRDFEPRRRCCMCGTSDPSVFLPGTDRCTRCAGGTPRELEAFYRRQPRRRDDPPWPYGPEQ